MTAQKTLLDHLHPWWPLLNWIVSSSGLLVALVALNSGSKQDLGILVTLQSQLDTKLGTLQKSYDGMQDRIATLEKSQKVAEVQRELAMVQLKVKDLENHYRAPNQVQNLNSFSALLSSRQNQLSDIQKRSYFDKLPSLPATVPNDLNWLKQQDKQSLGSLLDKTNKARDQSIALPQLPKIDLGTFKLSPPVEKSFIEKTWELIKEHPWLTALVVLFVLGALSKQ